MRVDHERGVWVAVPVLPDERGDAPQVVDGITARGRVAIKTRMPGRPQMERWWT
jgi:hypothetical protein